MRAVQWILGTLRDQLVNTLVTLLVVERFLTWKERWRWRRVRRFVMLQIEATLGDLLRVWSTWLYELRISGEPVVLSETALAAIRAGNISLQIPLPDADFELFVRLCAGSPDPSDSEPAFIDTAVPATFYSALSSYLVQRSLAASNLAWQRLVQELNVLLVRLVGFVDRLPEKVLSDDTIDFKTLLEELNFLLRKLDPALYPEDIWNSEPNQLDRADRIARAVYGIMLMMRLVRLTKPIRS